MTFTDAADGLLLEQFPWGGGRGMEAKFEWLQGEWKLRKWRQEVGCTRREAWL